MAKTNSNSNNRRFGVEFELFFTNRDFTRLLMSNNWQMYNKLFSYGKNHFVRTKEEDQEIRREVRNGNVGQFLDTFGYLMSMKEIIKYSIPSIGTKWIVEDDSTIVGTGGGGTVGQYVTYEIKTPPITISSGGFNQIDDFCNFFKEYASVNKSTGLHVHIEAKEFLKFKGKESQSSLPVKLMTALLSYKSIEPYFDQLVNADRRANKNYFAQKAPAENKIYAYYKGALESIEEDNNVEEVIYNFSENRYQKLNIEALNKYGTLEFRQMHGTFNQELIKNWILLGMNFIDTVLQIEETVRGYFTSISKERQDSISQLKGMIPAKTKRLNSPYAIKEVIDEMLFAGDAYVRNDAIKTFSGWVGNDPTVLSQAKLIIKAISDKKLNRQKELQAIEYLKKAIQVKQNKLVPKSLFNKAQKAYQANPIREEQEQEQS